MNVNMQMLPEERTVIAPSIADQARRYVLSMGAEDLLDVLGLRLGFDAETDLELLGLGQDEAGV